MYSYRQKFGRWMTDEKTKEMEKSLGVTKESISDLLKTCENIEKEKNSKEEESPTEDKNGLTSVDEIISKVYEKGNNPWWESVRYEYLEDVKIESDETTHSQSCPPSGMEMKKLVSSQYRKYTQKEWDEIHPELSNKDTGKNPCKEIELKNYQKDILSSCPDKYQKYLSDVLTESKSETNSLTNPLEPIPLNVESKSETKKSTEEEIFKSLLLKEFDKLKRKIYDIEKSSSDNMKYHMNKRDKQIKDLTNEINELKQKVSKLQRQVNNPELFKQQMEIDPYGEEKWEE
jgi:hypothetical protein